MYALRVEGEFHWGFWSRFPETSKVQSSFSIPPPTTLIGALAYPLIRISKIEEIKGEILVKDKVFLSPASIFEDLFYAVSIYFKENLQGASLDDINKYITIPFQMETINYFISENFVYKNADEIQGLSDLEKEIFKSIKEKGYIEQDALFKSEKLKGQPKSSLKNALNELIRKGIVSTIPRRILPKFRTGAIIVGKTYVQGGFVAGYLINEEEFSKIIGDDWKKKIELAAWNIIRIGSKESIVSINDVKLMEAKEIKEMRLKTKFYFPYACAKKINGLHYTENFWKGGWGRKVERKMVEYIIPGKKTPIESEALEVELNEKAKAYELLKEEVLIYGFS